MSENGVFWGVLMSFSSMGGFVNFFFSRMGFFFSVVSRGKLSKIGTLLSFLNF
jgi:hypothetical protein